MPGEQLPGGPNRTVERTSDAIFSRARDHGCLTEADIERLYVHHTGVERRPTCVQLSRMMRLVSILARLSKYAGGSVETNIPELARLVGLPTDGLKVTEIEDRFKTSIRRTLSYLEKAGLIENWESTWRGRARTGIVVRIPAGVAQLVRAAES